MKTRPRKLALRIGDSFNSASGRGIIYMKNRKRIDEEDKSSAEELLEQTGVFMRSCDEILSNVSGQSGIPDKGVPLPLRTDTPEKDTFAIDDLDEHSSTLLTLCNRYGGFLTKSLNGLSKQQKALFFDLIDEVKENLVSTAFSFALQEDISDRQRLIAMRFGIENILAFMKDDESPTDSRKDSSEVFLNLCNALGGLLTQCVNELSSADRELFLDKIDDVRDNALLAAFSFALEEGLSNRERKRSVHSGIRSIIDAQTGQTKDTSADRLDDDAPAFLEVFDMCGGLFIKYINRLPDQDQERFFEIITNMDKKAVETAFGPALQEGLLDMQRAPIIEAVIASVLGYADRPLFEDE